MKDFTKALNQPTKKKEQDLNQVEQQKENIELACFSFKADKELLKELKALAYIQGKTQAKIIEESIKEYFKQNKEEYLKAKQVIKDFNL